jgi:anthranilate phosphoribosyltransferase
MQSLIVKESRRPDSVYPARMESKSRSGSFPAARFIKEIGRGRKGARSLSRDEAHALYAAMLGGRVSDLELGAILLAMRIKGESVEEITGFLDAVEESMEKLQAPAAEYAPVVIPSYSGSRQLPNLTPLLALLLAREGVPVLLHGADEDPERVSSEEILTLLGIGAVHSLQEAQAALAQRKPVFVPIDVLAPRLAQLLSLRAILGVRSSAHTLVKLIQPFAQPTLRLVPYTHPEYMITLTDYFLRAAPVARGDAFLLRGTEGEPVANAKRAQEIAWFHDHERMVLVEKQEPVDTLPPLLPGRDAASTAGWIEAALRGEQPVPQSILEQVRHCVQAAKRLRTAGGPHGSYRPYNRG